MGRPDVNPGDVQSRLVELQSLMLDAQRALADAQDEIWNLRAQLAAKEALEQIETDLEFATDGCFWVRKSEKETALIPYCPVCWGKEKQLVVMGRQRYPGVYKCSVHEGRYTTKVYEDWASKQAAANQRDTPNESWWTR